VASGRQQNEIPVGSTWRLVAAGLVLRVLGYEGVRAAKPTIDAWKGTTVMTVSGGQAATLRAFLEGDRPRYNELLGQLDRETDSLGYGALVTAAFFEAADRRFSKQTTRSDVVEYVAEVRSRSGDIADAVDPRVAERLIHEVLGEGSTEDIDGRTSSATKLFLLAVLMADAGLGSSELDEFMTKVTKMAEHLAEHLTG
jgi:hypothetical protein